MSRWAFRFLLWYVCILFVQPQNRFTFLWPLRIANLSFIIATCLHVLSCLEGRRPLIRLGPATLSALALLVFATLSQHAGIYQISSGWNPTIDYIVKNCLLLIMIEAMAYSVERVWAVQMTTLFATLWWIKGGLRLSAMGATYSGDRLMGIAVSMIENPNGFAFVMCIFLPLYLYAYQQATRRWVRISFLACALAAVWIIFETGSRTGLVTLIALGVFLVPYYGRHRWKTLILVATVIVLIFPLTGEKNIRRFKTIPQSFKTFFSGEQRERTGPLSQDDQSAEERQAKNRDTWALIKEYPVFGVGVHSDANYYKDRFPMATGQVHCEILMAGRMMGSIGMILYAWPMAVILIGGGWVRKNAAHWPAVSAMGWTLRLQGVALVVGGAFSPHPWHPPMLLIAGCTSALIMNLREERSRAMEARAGLP